MKLKVIWIVDPHYVDGGCWAIASAKSGRLVAEMAQKGKSPAAKRLAETIVKNHNTITI